MASGTYTYNPANVKEPTKDRMRFELGDVMVDSGSDTTALTDAEIEAAIESYPKSWKRAKLMLLESLCRRFAYEVDTKTDKLWLYMQERAKLWRQDYESLKKEVGAESRGAPKYVNGGSTKPPYFYAGMHQNERVR